MHKLERFDWHRTGIVIGPGCFDQLAEDLRRAGLSKHEPVSVLCGHKAMQEQGFLARLKEQFEPTQVATFEGISENPTVEACDRAAAFLSGRKPAVLIALGGGSIIDTAKVANLAAGSGCGVADLMENPAKFGKWALARDFVAIPSTAGTGSEVTPFSTVWDFKANKKLSLDHQKTLPTLAYLDAQLTMTMDRTLTVTTALDSFGHAVESIWSRASKPASEEPAARSLRMTVTTLPALMNDLKNPVLRQAQLRAAMLAGMAISLTRTAAAHALSYGVTLKYGIPHGAAVAMFLPYVLELNLNYLPAERKKLLHDGFETQDDKALLKKFEDFVLGSGVLAGVKRLKLSEAEINAIIDNGFLTNRLSNNIHNPDRPQIERIVRKALAHGE